MNQKFYDKTWVKNLIIMGIPTIISAIGVLISLINMSFTLKIGLAIFNVALLLIFLRAIYWYSKNDDKYDEMLNDLRTDLEAKSEIVRVYTRLFEDWSEKIYDFVKLAKINRATNISWNKNEYYNTICIRCCEMIRRYCASEGNVSVYFVEYSVDETGEAFIEMVADSNPSPAKAKAYQRKEKLSESGYHYAKLIKEEYRGIEIAIDNNAVIALHGIINEDKGLTNCSQYIAIPIYCKENKILGIFQVITEYNCIIEKDLERMENFVRDKISPYTNSILLVDKIHKGLYLYAKLEEE